MHSAHHFYNFNQLVSGFIAQNKKVTNNVHLMKFENLKTCGSLWGNNSNSTHVDWWTAKHHFSRPRHKQDWNPRGPGMRIVVYMRNLLPVSRTRGQPSRYLKLSNNSNRTAVEFWSSQGVSLWEWYSFGKDIPCWVYPNAVEISCSDGTGGGASGKAGF